MVTRALGANGHRDGIALLERYDPEWRKRREIGGSGPARPIVFSPQLGTLAVVEEDDDGSEG
jgi:hypothetical protein